VPSFMWVNRALAFIGDLLVFDEVMYRV
jgi:hypothetical protein